jgi:hypothetical protein
MSYIFDRKQYFSVVYDICVSDCPDPHLAG